MLYQLYETQRALMAPFSEFASATAKLYNHPLSPFTHTPLAQRVSVFNKLTLARPKNRLFSLAGRFLYEDRWGGQMHYRPEFRKGDSVYAESIYTKRFELIGAYKLPIAGQNVVLSTRIKLPI